MRILIDSGDYRCSNMGDLAMLQVTVSRLHRLLPTATMHTITANPELLKEQVPQSIAVPQVGLKAWFAEKYILGRLHDALPKFASEGIVRFKGALRRRLPALVESMMKGKMRMTGVIDHSALEFIETVHESDSVVLCGQGGINDLFQAHARAVLDFVDMATRSGKPTILFGQGIGPLSNNALLNKARAVLSRAVLIAVREGRSSPLLLRSMNVAPEKIFNTGDDTVEMAFANRPEKMGEALGVNIRAAAHTAISAEMLERLRSVFQRLAARYGVTVLPVPISRHPDCKDARDIQQLLAGANNFSDNGRELDTPLKVIQQTGRCRIVITAAYHAAVFALSQGIPVVGLAKSQYCADKFLGLVHQFGEGVSVAMLDSPGIENELETAVEKAWKEADTARDSLLEAASRQVESGLLAYERAAELLSGAKAVA